MLGAYISIISTSLMSEGGFGVRRGQQRGKWCPGSSSRDGSPSHLASHRAVGDQMAARPPRWRCPLSYCIRCRTASQGAPPVRHVKTVCCDAGSRPGLWTALGTGGSWNPGTGVFTSRSSMMWQNQQSRIRCLPGLALPFPLLCPFYNLSGKGRS